MARPTTTFAALSLLITALHDCQGWARRWFADTQFDAVLFCGDCRVPSPPPLPAALAPAGATASAAAVRVPGF